MHTNLKNSFKLGRALATVFVAIAAVLALTLSGCSAISPTTTGSDQELQKDPYTRAQEFVTSLNSISSEITQKSQDYSKAVGEGDSVNAKVAMTAIGEALDKVQNLEVPDEIKDEADKYKSACSSLKDSLNKLNDCVIASIENSGADNGAAAAVSEAQGTYDQAVQDLKDADGSLKTKVEDLKNQQTGQSIQSNQGNQPNQSNQTSQGDQGDQGDQANQSDQANQGDQNSQSEQNTQAQ